MTVKELINALNKYPQDLPVAIDVHNEEHLLPTVDAVQCSIGNFVLIRVGIPSIQIGTHKE